MYARVALVVLTVAVAACGSGGERDEVPSALGPQDATGESYVAGSCAHDPCAIGAKLTKSCNSCVTKICGSDSYCCATKWDQQCVNEVGSICRQSCGGGGGGGGSNMKIAVFGDCRPPNLEGTNNYPSAIIGNVFKLAASNGAQLAIGTGDYVFSNTTSGVSAQLALFQQARANYGGPVYLDMGNHECSGYTSSNCPNGNETPNVKAYLAELVPAGVTKPYFRVDVPAAHGTAKLLFVAANAWSAAQQSWLQSQLADPTFYTFVIRHEPAADTTAPGVSPSESLIKAAAYTLELNGHTHEYKHVDARHVISGNAGAPLQSGAAGYGLLIIDELDNGNISVSELDESSGNVTDTWTVTP